jgi:hypothetical protein
LPLTFTADSPQPCSVPAPFASSCGSEAEGSQGGRRCQTGGGRQGGGRGPPRRRRGRRRRAVLFAPREHKVQTKGRKVPDLPKSAPRAPGPEPAATLAKERAATYLYPRDEGQALDGGELDGRAEGGDQEEGGPEGREEQAEQGEGFGPCPPSQAACTCAWRCRERVGSRCRRHIKTTALEIRLSVVSKTGEGTLTARGPLRERAQCDVR